MIPQTCASKHAKSQYDVKLRPTKRRILPFLSPLASGSNSVLSSLLQASGNNKSRYFSQEFG